MGLDIKLLIGSQFLSFKELFYIHLVLKLEWKTINYILTCHPQDCGPARYLQWKQSLFLNPNRNSDDDLSYYKSVLKEFVLSSTAPHSEVVLSGSIPGEILRDVVRTYQASPFFKEGGYGRNMLQNVLCALVKSRPDVGYCQGMNFVVGAIIIGRLPPSVTHMALAPGSGAKCDAINAVDKVEIELEGDEYLATRVNMTEEDQTNVESDVFHLMLDLFDKHGKLAMNGLWADRVPKLKLRVYQLDRLLKWNYPRLHDHFDALKLSPEVLTAQWFVTLFAYNLPLHTTLHLWDYLFETGWEGIFKVAISLLGAMESQFMALEDLEGFAMLMREWKKLGHLNINMTVSELLNRAHKLVINSEVLTRLQECFGTEILSLAVYCQKEEREVQARLDKESVKTGGTSSNSNISGNSGSFSSVGGSSSSHGGAAQGSSMHSGTTIYNSNLTNGNHHTGHNNTRNYSGSNSNNQNSHASSSQNNTNRGSNSNHTNITINTSITDSNNAFSRTNSNTSTGSNGNSNHSPSASQKKELAIGHGKYLNLALKTAFSLYNGTQNGTKDNTINNSSRDSNNNLNSSVHSQSSTTSSNSSFQASSSPSYYNRNANHSANHSNNSTAPTTPVQHAVAAAELEEQQGRGSVIEDEVEDNKIKLGEELPTYWLLRYGNKLSLHEIEELCNYRVEIRKLDRLVDVDKAKLHVKIIKACEFHRATQEELESATEENLHYTHLVDTLTASFQHSLVHAQDLAEAVARLMDVYHIKQDVSSQDSFSGKEMSGYGGVNNMIGSPQPGTGSRKMRSNSVAALNAGSGGNSGGNSNSNGNNSNNSNSSSSSSAANMQIGKRHSLNSFMRENGHFNSTNNSGASANNNSANVSIGTAPKRYSLRTALYNTVTGTNDDNTSSSSNSCSSNVGANSVANSGSSGGNSSGNTDNDVNSLQSNNASVMFPRMRNALRLSAPSTTTTTPQTTHSTASASNHFPTLFTTPTKQQPTSNTNSPKVKRKAKDIKDHDISELLGVIITSRTSLSKTDRTSTRSGNTTTNRTSGASRTSTSTTITTGGGGAQQQMRQNSQDTNGSDTSDDDGADEGTDTTSRRRLYGISGVTPTMSAQDKNETSGSGSGSGSGAAKRQSWRDSIRSTLQSAVSGAAGSAGTTPTNAASSAQIAGGSNGLRSSSSSLTTSDSTTPETSTQNSSISNNADVSVSAAITQENIQNIHRIGDSDVITIELNPAADSFSTGDRIRAGDGVAGSGGIARQLRHLEKQSQHSQQKIIEIHRSLEEAKKALAASKKRLQTAVVNDDEAMVWKKSLCDQLQLLVEDSNRGRSQKLIFISENYLL